MFRIYPQATAALAHFAGRIGFLLICLATVSPLAFSTGIALAQDFPEEFEVDSNGYTQSAPCNCSACQVQRRGRPNCRTIAPGWWLDAEYLHWWPNGSQEVPLATTSLAGTTAARSGILGLSSTRTLAQSNSLTEDGINAGRVTLGYWTCPKTDAIVLSYFGGGIDEEQNYASTGTSILARPYFDQTTGSNAALLIAHPTFLTGSLKIEQEFAIQGAEAMVRSLACEGRSYRWDWLFGYRYLDLDEELKLSSSSRYTVAQGAIPVGTTRAITDRFETDNAFHGVQAGFAYRELFSCVALDVQMQLAVGGTTSHSTIAGSSINSVPGAGSSQFTGGLLAQSTNIGRTTNRDASLVPELRAGLSTRLTDCVRFSVGYNLLAWTNIYRASDQIDTRLSQLPPEAAQGDRRPAVRNDTSTLLMQGVNVGVQFEY